MAVGRERHQGPVAGARGTRPFDVFLSHNSRDRAIVERIAERLKRAGMNPWLDKWSLTPGGDWQRELGEGLDASAACAVFVGPHDLGAWELQEVALAVDRAATQHGFRVFPVLLPGVEEPFDPNRLPHFLRARTWVDLRHAPAGSRSMQTLVNAIKGVPFGPDVAVAADDAVAPYRGLRVFAEEDAQFFFGRDREIQRLLEKLKSSAFLAVLGPSGSGKSSLVRAGLVPALRSGALDPATDWRICVMRPGASPLTALAARLLELCPGASMQSTLDGLARDERSLQLSVELALADAGERDRVLVVVDQLEEVFTLCRDETQRRRLFSNLLYASTAPGARTVVVVTMRADFYARCAAYPELAQLVAAQQLLVGPMDADGLRQAIEEPARRVGLELEEGLTETIVADVAAQPGALPLLEHALLELWERRRGGMLTLEGYRETGGVEGALAQRADEIFAQLSPTQQEVARRAFLRLTQPGEGTEDTRRRAQRSELERTGTDGDLDDVLARLVDARMLTTGRDESGLEVVDVSHEALIRGWPRLRGWIDADRSGLVIHRRLTDAAREWEHLDREPGALYRGARLATALEWASGNDEDLSELERAFLAASETAQYNELAEAKRRTRRLRLLAGGLAGLTGIAAVLAVWALEQTGTANRERDRALSQQLGSAATAEVATDPELALLLAREAARLDHTTQAEDALRAALASPVEAVLHGNPADAADVAFSADGRMAVTTAGEKVVRIWDLGRARLLHTIRPGVGTVSSVALSSDDEQLLIGGRRGAELWDAAGPARAAVLPAEGLRAEDCRFTPSGRQAACTGRAAARIWDVRERSLLASPRLPESRSQSNVDEAAGSAISQDGTVVALASPAGAIRIHSAESGERVRTLAGDGEPLASLQLDATGARVLSLSSEGSLLLRETGTGRVLLRTKLPLIGRRKRLADVVLHPSGRKLVVSPVGPGTDDPPLEVWDVATGTRRTLQTPQYGMSDVRFSPGGRLAVGSVADGAAVLDLASGARLMTLPSVGTGEIARADFTPAGDRILTSDYNGELKLWIPGITLLADGPTTFTNAAISPDGGLVAAADGATLHVYRADTGRPAGPPGPTVPTEGPDGAVAASLVLAFSADGARLRGWAADDAVHDIDPESGADDVTRITGYPTSIAASGAYTLIREGGTTQSVKVLDLRSGGERLEVAGRKDDPIESGIADAALTADGARLAVAMEDGSAEVWDAERKARLRRVEVSDGDIGAIAIAPDGRHFATTDDSGVLEVYDVATGSARRLTGTLSSGVLVDLDYSPDGSLVIANGDLGDRTEVYDAATGRRVVTFPGGSTVEVGPHRARVALTSTERPALLQRCDQCGTWRQLLERADGRIHRELTPAERKRFLDGG